MNLVHFSKRVNKTTLLLRTLTDRKQTKLHFKDDLLSAPESTKPTTKVARNEDLAATAAETKNVLPGLLLTRPDAKAEGYLYEGAEIQRLNPTYCPRLASTAVRVVDADSIDAALGLINGATPSGSPNSSRLSSAPKEVCVLNMANQYYPGGGWLVGSQAQEEALCYRTSLSFTLKRRFYPLPNLSGVYSPKVLIIRESPVDGHQLLDCRVPQDLQVISVVSVAGIRDPYIKDDIAGCRSFLYPYDRYITAERIRIILRIAIRNRHRQIVLGALGCGAFNNPKEEVAKMFRAIFKEREFSGGWWQDVVFAVLDNGKNGNFQIFY